MDQERGSQPASLASRRTDRRRGRRAIFTRLALSTASVTGSSSSSSSPARAFPMTCVLFVLSLQTAVVAISNRAPELQSEALERLSRVFGIQRLPARAFHRSPPEYMTGLYRATTDSGGLTKTNSPYNANIVRSFPDRAYRRQMHFFYNISNLQPRENILEAEFHLFKLRPKAHHTGTSHLLTIKVYQVLSSEKKLRDEEELRLLDAKKISAYTHGWFSFKVGAAVREWVNGTAHNYGFLVVLTSPAGKQLPENIVRFAQRMEHHDSKQPIIVIFTDDGVPRHPNYISPTDEGYQEIKDDIVRNERMRQFRRKEFKHAIRMLNEKDREEYESAQQSFGNLSATSGRSRNRTTGGGGRREKRSPRSRKKRRSCTRYEMYVDFDAIGWSGWIISPKGYNAYHCLGECPFPLGQSQRPTNHATVQSIVHALRVGEEVATPCCVPDKLYSISLLYFDDDENVVLKLYEDMVAASCGCH